MYNVELFDWIKSVVLAYSLSHPSLSMSPSSYYFILLTIYLFSYHFILNFFMVRYQSRLILKNSPRSSIKDGKYSKDVDMKKRRVESIFKSKRNSPFVYCCEWLVNRSNQGITKLNRHCKMNISQQVHTHLEWSIRYITSINYESEYHLEIKLKC